MLIDHFIKYTLAMENIWPAKVLQEHMLIISKITLQLIFVIILLLLFTSFIFWNILDIVMTGILFGIAEKLNDEFQRYAQFRNNSQNLFYLALSKLIPISISALLSYTLVVDIRFAFQYY